MHAFLWKLGAFNRLQFHSYSRLCRRSSGVGEEVHSASSQTADFYQTVLHSHFLSHMERLAMYSYPRVKVMLSACKATGVDFLHSHRTCNFKLQLSNGKLFWCAIFFLLIKMIKMKDKGPIIFYQWPNVLTKLHVLNLELSHSVWQNYPW